MDIWQIFLSQTDCEGQGSNPKREQHQHFVVGFGLISQILLKKLLTFGGYFEKCHFCKKTAVATFWATLGNNWDTFCFKIWSHCPILPK